MNKQDLKKLNELLIEFEELKKEFKTLMNEFNFSKEYGENNKNEIVISFRNSRCYFNTEKTIKLIGFLVTEYEKDCNELRKEIENLGYTFGVDEFI